MIIYEVIYVLTSGLKNELIEDFRSRQYKDDKWQKRDYGNLISKIKIQRRTFVRPFFR